MRPASLEPKPAPQTARGIAGPNQARLQGISGQINATAPVQRVIEAAKTQGTGSKINKTIMKHEFIVNGRAGRHATAKNKRALVELRDWRRANKPAKKTLKKSTNLNNKFEEALKPGSLKQPKLDMAHKLSDNAIQGRVADLAKAALENPGKNTAALKDLLDDLVEMVNPTGVISPNELSSFHFSAVFSHFVAATAANDILKRLVANPFSKDSLLEACNRFCNSVANSPMNLHLGDASTNRRIGPHVDLNVGHDGSVTPRSQKVQSVAVKHGFTFKQGDGDEVFSSGFGGSLSLE